MKAMVEKDKDKWDAKIKKVAFEAGDKVMLTHEGRYGLEPKYKGPYVVVQSFPDFGTYKLQTLAGEPLQSLVHVDRMRIANGHSSNTPWYNPVVARQEWRQVMTNIGRAAAVPEVPPVIVTDELIVEAPVSALSTSTHSAVDDFVLPEPVLVDPLADTLHTNVSPIVDDSVVTTSSATDLVGSGYIGDNAVDHVDPVEPNTTTWLNKGTTVDPMLSPTVSISANSFPLDHTVDIDSELLDDALTVDVADDPIMLDVSDNTDPIVLDPTPDMDLTSGTAPNNLPQSHTTEEDVFVDAYTDLPDSHLNFDIDVEDVLDDDDSLLPAPDTASDAPPTPVSSSVTGTSSQKVQSRTSSQEGGNVIENSDSKHRQPIEVEYNLPFRYNPNKRRFKPQLLNKKRKKTRLNLTSVKLLPLRKVRLLIDSSRHNTQSSSSI